MCEIWTQCVYCDVDTTFVCSVYMKFRLRLFNLFIQKVSSLLGIDLRCSQFDLSEN